MRLRRELPVLLAVTLDLAGFGMLIPDVQLRAEAWGAPGWFIGVIIASTFLTQTLTSGWWGRVADHYGRRKIYVLVSLIAAGALAIYGLMPAGALWVMLLSRALLGFGGANLAIAQSIVTAGLEQKERTAALGRIGAATFVGITLGPAIGGQLADMYNHHILGFTAAAVCLLAIAVFSAVFFTTDREEVEEPNIGVAKTNEPWRFSDLWALVRDYPVMKPLIMAGLIASLGAAILEGTFGRLIQDTLGLGRSEFGAIFAYESVVGFIVQAVLLAWIVRRVPERAVLWVAYALFAIGLAMFPVMPSYGALFVASTIYAVGGAAALPTWSSLASSQVPERRSSELFGFLQAVRSVAYVIGPIVGGQLFDWSPGLPYYLAGGIALVASGIAFVWGARSAKVDVRSGK